MDSDKVRITLNFSNHESKLGDFSFEAEIPEKVLSSTFDRVEELVDIVQTILANPKKKSR